MTFAGKVVLVSGGTGALGCAVSLAFLHEGADSMVTYRNDREWRELQGLAGTDANRLAGHQVDVKAAAVALIDSLAADLAGSGVRANSILPSIIDTEANRTARPMRISRRSKTRGHRACHPVPVQWRRQTYQWCGYPRSTADELGEVGA